MRYYFNNLQGNQNRQVYKMPGADTQTQQANGITVIYGEIPTIESVASFTSTSAMFGASVVDKVRVESGSFKKLGINGAPEFVPYPAYTLPATCTLEVSLAKTIIRTHLVSAKGTFQEIVGQDDYRVTIRGVILATDEADRNQQIETLVNYANIDAPLEVVCEFLELFKISRLIIESLTFPETRGAPLRKDFELVCYSSITPILVEQITG